MSSARKCDLCGMLFELVPRCCSLEVSVTQKADPNIRNTWSEVDFCAGCSTQLLALIGPALDDLDKP